MICMGRRDGETPVDPERLAFGGGPIRGPIPSLETYVSDLVLVR